MSELEQIKQKIGDRKNYLRESFGVEEIGIFGSFARNEATKDSDLDMLVTLKEPIGYFRFFELEKYIKSIIGRNIDLATKEAIKPVIRQNIMKDLVLI